MTEEQRQQYLKDNFNQQPARIAMTPISEKDTIYEQTSKASLQIGLKYAEETKKKQSLDERKLTGTGKYSFQS
jgi:hypothetical protein